MTVQLQKATQYHYYGTVMAIFPLAPDQTTAQMWSNGVWSKVNETKASFRDLLCHAARKQPGLLYSWQTDRKITLTSFL